MVRNWTANDGNQQQSCHPACRQPGFRAPLPSFAGPEAQAVAWPAPAQCPPAGLADLRISSAALSVSVAEGGGRVVRGRAPSSSGKCPFRRRSILGTTRSRRGCGLRREAGFRRAVGHGSLGHSQQQAYSLSGTASHLVSHPKQGKPPRCAGKLQCRLAAFRPPSSSEHRRCYTSRTLSVWSPGILALAGLKLSKSFLCHHSRSAVGFLCLGFFLPSTSIISCLLLCLFLGLVLL